MFSFFLILFDLLIDKLMNCILFCHLMQYCTLLLYRALISEATPSLLYSGYFVSFSLLFCFDKKKNVLVIMFLCFPSVG